MPIEIFSTLASDEPFSFSEFIGETLLSILMSIVVMAMYMPVIGGTLSRHTLVSEDAQLKVGGSLVANTTLIGGILGSLGQGWVTLSVGGLV